MKIASVVCAYPPYAGGMAISAYRLEKILAENNEVSSFTPANIQPWLRYGHGAFLPQILWKLRNFDYIYLHYPFFGTAEIVWLFKLIFRKPKLIIHYHMDVKNSNLITKLLALPSLVIRKHLFNQADKIICASSDYVANGQIKDYYHKHQDKFLEIPFSLDLNKFKPKLNDNNVNQIMIKAKEIVDFVNKKFIKRGRKEFLFVGGLDEAHYFKGIPVLLEAVSRLESNDWRLNIIGEGNLKSSYESMATNLGINKQVFFKGKLSDNDVIRAYQSADLLILPSINNNEAFGIVLIEALACGTPVIASNLPGVRRVFKDGQEGLLVEPNSIDDLKSKLQYILENEDKRLAMSEAARRLAKNKYDDKLTMDKLKKVFI